ncbi:hypothetical protein B0F90DRAFT_1638345 [Multifurca ochricompacta]|uniref:Mediator complex subunit 11 n=1 Tax=Multifurca ochricompacta TaxID=376703 RepID=A0AAD4LYZ5_9AGAM|nr:hypothetical protein B0F90DRAFT_1638345 [Multifurca ochricompacta]
MSTHTSTSTSTSQHEYDSDPIFSSSRTARQIHDLALPQTDAPDAGLPKGDERSEQFVAEVGQYFETLDGIQMALRSSLAHIRAASISPAVLTAPPNGFVPPPQGSGDKAAGGGVEVKDKTRGLLEERVERDAWRGVLDALSRLRDARRAEAEAEAEREKKKKNEDGDIYMS